MRPESEPYWDEDQPTRIHRREPRTSFFLVILVSALISALVTAGLNWVLVPSGVGWRKLEHEGIVTVPGINNAFKVHYPSSFSKPPSLVIEPQGGGEWFWRMEEQTESYFVITNTTVQANTGQPVHLTIHWKASGGRW